MKTSNFFLLGIVIVSFAFGGCNKEKAIENNNNQLTSQNELSSQIPFNKITVREKGYKGTNGSTQVLVFEDMQSVSVTIDALYSEVNEWTAEFVEKYKDLSDDERNELAEKIGFNEQQPLFDFNNYFSFYSLYQKIDKEELEWLATLEGDNPDFSLNPDNHFIFQYSTRAILNTDCEVQVGDTIYKLTEDGYYAICNKSMSTLSFLNNNLSNYQLIPNVIFVGDEYSKASGCNSNKRKEGWQNNSNNDKRKINWVVSHWTHPWTRRCAAKVDNYKKSGSWKKYSTYCKVRTYGFISDVDQNGNADCDKQLNFNPNNVYKDPTAKHEEHFITVSTKTTSGWVKGYFYGADGATTDQTLTW